jgi:hypothetical protein
VVSTIGEPSPKSQRYFTIAAPRADDACATYGTLVVFVGVAILAGMLAAILPARRASRLNVLE